MNALRLEHFIQANDLEAAQYRILHGLQAARAAFSHNQVYPHLGALVQLFDTLQALVQDFDAFKKQHPGTLTGIDWEAQKLIYTTQDFSVGHLGHIEELIHWALPFLQEAIEEGRTIYEFVEEHLHLAEVGVMPAYVEEGYLIVPDRKTAAFHILQYSLSIFTAAEARYRSLKTQHIKTLPAQPIQPTPHRIKLDLLAENRDLPNPATFAFETALDFPYEQTMLPIAKRKLMRHLYQQGGSA